MARSAVRHAQSNAVDRISNALRLTALLTLGVYMTLMLGTNAAATGISISWSPIRQLFLNGEHSSVSLIVFLPVLSVVSWLAYRRCSNTHREIIWGHWGFVLPITLLWATAMLNVCGRGSCDLAGLLRLIALFSHVAWVYLLVINERFDWFWIVVGIVSVQASVAVVQFVTQGDLGLMFLGEPALDPAESGISIVMRDGERWLRGYGLTTHPNTLVRILLPGFFLLLIAMRQHPSRRYQVVGAAAFALTYAGILTTLSRWGVLCLLLGLAIASLPAGKNIRHKTRSPVSGKRVSIILLISLITVVFIGKYGNTITGRVISLDTPTEQLSIWERQRDTTIGLDLLQRNLLRGIGFGHYAKMAQIEDVWAEIVHSVPLLWGVELGIVGLLLWFVLLVAPIIRPGLLGRYSFHTGLWLSFWLLGLLDTKPNPLVDVRSALLTGFVAAVAALSFHEDRARSAVRLNANQSERSLNI